MWTYNCQYISLPVHVLPVFQFDRTRYDRFAEWQPAPGESVVTRCDVFCYACASSARMPCDHCGQWGCLNHMQEDWSLDSCIVNNWQCARCAAETFHLCASEQQNGVSNVQGGHPDVLTSIGDYDVNLTRKQKQRSEKMQHCTYCMNGACSHLSLIHI